MCLDSITNWVGDLFSGGLGDATGTAAAGAGGGLSSGVLAGGPIGAGALGGTLSDFGGAAAGAGGSAAGDALGGLASGGIDLSGLTDALGGAGGVAAGGGGVSLGELSGAFGGGGATQPPIPGGASGPAWPGGGTSAASLAPGYGYPGAGTGDLTVGAYDTTALPDAGAATAAQPVSGAAGNTYGLTPAEMAKFGLGDGAGGGGGGGLMDKITGLAKDLGIKNLAPLVGGAGLLYNMAQPTKTPYTGTLATTANNLSAQGAQLQSYLTSGTLPPGAEASVNQAVQSAKAATRSNYARMGMTGSSAEIAALNAIDANAKTQAFDIANKLLATGLNETQMSTELYKTLMSVNQQENDATAKAIASLAASLGGGTQIKIGGT